MVIAHTTQVKPDREEFRHRFGQSRRMFLSPIGIVSPLTTNLAERPHAKRRGQPETLKGKKLRHEQLCRWQQAIQPTARSQTHCKRTVLSPASRNAPELAVTSN